MQKYFRGTIETEEPTRAATLPAVHIFSCDNPRFMWLHLYKTYKNPVITNVNHQIILPGSHIETKGH